ncbi:MAG: SPFH domain-containing protein [Anaerolineae bacterium]
MANSDTRMAATTAANTAGGPVAEARTPVRGPSGIAISVFMVLTAIAVGLSLLMDTQGVSDDVIVLVVLPIMAVALYLLYAIRVANEWEKAVVLRLGRFHSLRGPGMFLVLSPLDSVTTWIDHRVMVTPFNAEKTLTKDTVPVDVDAVLFWLVWDAQKAALEVASYRAAIAWAAQTALREVIGQMTLADILVGRAKMDMELQRIIDERTTPWGVSVQSVEIRDVIIPQALEDSMAGRRRPSASARHA